MKKLVLLSFFTASFSLVQAQVRPGGSLSSTDYATGSTGSRNNGFGVKGGFNLTNVYGSDKSIIDGRRNLNTFLAGVYAQFGLNDRVSIQPELLYARQGYRYNETVLVGSSQQRVNRLDYVKLPVLLVYNLTDNVSVHVGPEVAILTKIKQAGKDLSISNSGYRSLDYGVVGGAEFRLGPARVGARYDLGIAKIVKYASLHNQAFQAYVAFGVSN